MTVASNGGCNRWGAAGVEYILSCRYEQIQGSFRRYSSFGHAKTRPGGICRDGFEELNCIVPYDRLPPLGERPTQFGQAIFCNCRIRYLVTPKLFPTSPRVF